MSRVRIRSGPVLWCYTAAVCLSVLVVNTWVVEGNGPQTNVDIPPNTVQRGARACHSRRQKVHVLWCTKSQHSQPTPKLLRHFGISLWRGDGRAPFTNSEPLTLTLTLTWCVGGGSHTAPPPPPPPGPPPLKTSSVIGPKFSPGLRPIKKKTILWRLRERRHKFSSAPLKPQHHRWVDLPPPLDAPPPLFNAAAPPPPPSP